MNYVENRITKAQRGPFEVMRMRKNEHKDLVQRISISLPPVLAESLDRLVGERGFQNRSQAVAEMIESSVNRHHEEAEDTIMAGTITLFYDAARPGLLQKLSEVEREHIEECISSQHVLLEGDHVMEVLIVQGPVKRLRELTNCLQGCKGVSTAGLTLSTKILPPLHGRGSSTGSE